MPTKSPRRDRRADESEVANANGDADGPAGPSAESDRGPSTEVAARADDAATPLEHAEPAPGAPSNTNGSWPPTERSRRALNERATFTEIYQEHVSYVMGFIRWCRVKEPFVDDVTQEVFLAVHQRLHTFEARSSLLTWITGIARHKAKDFLRKQVKTKNDGAERLDDIPDWAPSPERACASAKERDLMLEALDHLPPDQRTALVLYEVAGMSVDEIMEVTSSCRFTVYSRLGTARNKVRVFFDRAKKREREP